MKSRSICLQCLSVVASSTLSCRAFMANLQRATPLAMIPSSTRHFATHEDNGEIGVGIDLGTTNSAVAYLEGDRPIIIEIPNNGRTMKSVVAFDASGAPLVGNEAVEWERKTQTSAYRHVKRVIGTGANFLTKEIVEVVPHLVPLASPSSSSVGKSKKTKKKAKAPSLQRLIEDAKENPTMLYTLEKDDEGKHSSVSPETISAAILERLVRVAEAETKKKITRAVIGVPAYFNDAQREATIRAANEAGINKVKLLREPEAAALAYGVDKESQEEELVLVFDLGGGTYDVSILLVEKGLTEIVCTSGDAQLGGSNFDAKIAKRLSGVVGGCCKSEECSDIIIRAAECIRIYLSNNRLVNLALPLTDTGWIELGNPDAVIVDFDDASFEADTKNSTHVFARWTRKEVEKFCLDELLLLLRPIREVAIMAGALLPGDASPSVVESAIEIEEAFKETEKFYGEDSDRKEELPPEAQEVAELDFKAAKRAQQKGRKRARETTKKERKYRAEAKKANEAEGTASDTRIRAEGISGRPISRVVLVGGATRMPAIGRLISAVAGITPQKTVDPDEAVALGCAVHVGVLDGNENMGTVLNPMQAAILRAIAEKKQRDGELDDLFTDEEEFGEFEEMQFL